MASPRPGSGTRSTSSSPRLRPLPGGRACSGRARSGRARRANSELTDFKPTRRMTVNTTVNPEVRGGWHGSRLYPSSFRSSDPVAGRQGACAPALGGPGPALRGRIHGDPRDHRGERGAPVHRPDLGLGAAGLPWVITAYVLMTGGLTLLGGRAADLLGRKRVSWPGWRCLGGVPGQRPGAGGWPADRRPGRAGKRRRAAHPGCPVGDHRDVRRRAAGHRAERLGGAGAAGAALACCWAGADHLARLAVGVPD